MIRNNLAILMSERGIKNNYLSLKTGISKNTISSTTKNDGKMIQLETINKICQVLDVTPDDFFSYIPYDFEFIIENIYSIDKTLDTINLEFIINVLNKNVTHSVYEFDFKINKDSYLDNVSIDIENNDESEKDSFSNFWDEIPVTFRNDLTKEMKEYINDFLTLHKDTLEIAYDDDILKESTNFSFFDIGVPF